MSGRLIIRSEASLSHAVVSEQGDLTCGKHLQLQQTEVASVSLVHLARVADELFLL